MNSGTLIFLINIGTSNWRNWIFNLT